MKTIYTTIFFLVGIVAANAATIVINWSVSADRTLQGITATPLSAGTGSPGNGTFVQLGYYSLATLTNPFSGAWVSLAATTIGDDGVEVPGRFSTSSILGGVPFSAPSIGTPLAIRFYDGTSVANSLHFNAASNTNGTWSWVSPSDPAPIMNLVIDKSIGIVFQSGVVGAYSTQLTIPEPSALVLFSLGLSILTLNRRRLKKKNSRTRRF